MTNVTVIILTLNEAKHIRRCIDSLKHLNARVCVCDAHSTDETVEIVSSLGGEVKQNSWTNYATQFNWALDNFEISTPWTMRMDADEYITPELSAEIIKILEGCDGDTSHLYVKRRVYFMGRWIKHGGYYPTWLLRVWRDQKAYCEMRWMDEHIKVTRGKGVQLKNDIVDDNLNNLTWWTNKHNHYATREAVDLLNTMYRFFPDEGISPSLFGNQEQRKRWLKIWYAKLPLFLRPFLYFFYRYVLRVGFLDLKQGLIWHFLQGFWYRFLVDAKIFEVYLKAGRSKEKVAYYLKKEWNVILDE